MKQLVSYDQLSKTRRNLAAARQVPHFDEPLRVLDYGFGLGTFLVRLPRRHRISGVELSDAAARNLKRLCSLLLRSVTLYAPDALADLPPATFDCICCSHVLEHVDDDLHLLVEFHRVLTDNGSLVLNLPINEVWSDPNHVRSYTASSAIELLERAGFGIERVEEADRWTALVLDHERNSRRVPRSILRALRLGLALLPPRVLDATELLLASRYEPQQLIIVAKKV
jgi:SAM-dependent methyltransferase